MELVIRGGIRIDIESIDAREMRARVCLTRQAGRDDAEGVLFLGSIAVGDGWVLLKDVLFRVPPKGGPLHDVVEQAVRSGIRGIVAGGPVAAIDRGTSHDIDALRRIVASLEQKGP
jgi:hypothetical protein